MTVYTMALPWEAVLRVWDMVLREGTKVIFRTGLAILHVSQRHLLTKCPTVQELIPHLLHLPADMIDTEQLVRTICQTYSQVGWEECARYEALINNQQLVK